MLWVSELPGARWPPCADVRLRWLATRTRHLAFIYIYGCTSCVAAIFTRPWVKCTASEPRYTLSHTYTHTQRHTRMHSIDTRIPADKTGRADEPKGVRHTHTHTHT